MQCISEFMFIEKEVPGYTDCVYMVTCVYIGDR